MDFFPPKYSKTKECKEATKVCCQGRGGGGVKVVEFELG